MHIPICETTELDVLTFKDALDSKERDEYDAEKWLYVPPFYSEYRYILGKRGKNPLICVGINPSTAKPGALDNTVRNVESVADRNGYDGWLMFNVYPQRATNPDDMDKILNIRLYEENLKALRYILDSYEEGFRPSIWAAWGTIIEKRPYLVEIVKAMIDLGNEYGAEWYSFGKISKKGHPHHPLYLKLDSPRESFDISAYVESLERLSKKK